MSTSTVLAEPTTFSAKPGRKVYLRDPLNQADSIDISIDWGPWIGSETISSVAWDAESGITVSGASNTNTVASCTITAGTVEDEQKIECAITTSGSQIRSVVLIVEVVNLK